ncbi:MAG: hypothetical protein AAB309_00745 [Deltaproteobacteria bacterium]
MRLFTFAHRGEAQVFLKRGNYKPISFFFDGLYENGGDLLLITGEGLQKTTEKAAAVCASYHKEISHLINFGVAGSLSPELTLGEIYSVRTVYKEDEFHSFTTRGMTSFGAPHFDCISALERVVNDEKAAKLGCFAQIVDRELWAIGSLASLFRIPFQSHKLIADEAGSQTSCFDLRERAAVFSEKIHDYFCQNVKSEKIEPSFSEKKVQLPEGFYATVSQSQKLENLAQKLALKWQISPHQIFERVNLETLKKEEKHPKKRTTFLLKLLTKKLTPKIHPQ